MSSFFRVHVRDIRFEDADIFAGFCFDFGAAGVEEPLSFTQPDLTFDPVVTEKPLSDFHVYFETAPNPIFLEEIPARFPGSRCKLLEEQHKDWMAEWKKGFVSFQLTGDYWVVPSWLPVPQEAKRPLFIDPGMAFGTGTHATTQLAAKFVLETMTDIGSKGADKYSVADIGSGTGILAMLARMEGASKVLANDIDPEARRVARENLAHNKMPEIEVTEKMVDQIDDRFDLVIANIIDGVLLMIRDSLVRLVSREGGRLLISGILVEREADFLPKFLADTGLRVLRREQKDEWLAFVLSF